MVGSMGVETEVLRAIICCPLCWRNFCRSRSPDHIPLLPRVSREQVCLKAVSNHPSLFPMSYFIIFDEWALWSSCHRGRVIFEVQRVSSSFVPGMYFHVFWVCFLKQSIATWMSWNKGALQHDRLTAELIFSLVHVSFKEYSYVCSSMDKKYR